MSEETVAVEPQDAADDQREDEDSSEDEAE